MVVIDSPGMADSNNENIFLNEILKAKEKLLKVGSIKIILVIKFDMTTSKGFLDASKDLKKYFGTEALKSVLILAIQVNEKRIFSNDEFKNIIKKSDGYLYLKELNNGQDVQFCLWDNIRPYKNQEIYFEKCMQNLEPYDKKSLMFLFDLVSNEKEHLEKLNNQKEDYESEYLETQKINNCIIF